MTGLGALIREHNTGEPDSTVAAVFDAINLPTKWRAIFHQVTRDECRRLQRATVRAAEWASDDQTPNDTQCPPVVAGSSRSDYLAERFYTGSRYVTWGEATVEDHQARIVYLETLVAGTRRTIDRHREAVASITEAGVACLDQLAKAVAA